MEKLCTKCGKPGVFYLKRAFKFSKKENKMMEYTHFAKKCGKCIYAEKIERENLKLEIITLWISVNS